MDLKDHINEGLKKYFAGRKILIKRKGIDEDAFEARVMDASLLNGLPACTFLALDVQHFKRTVNKTVFMQINYLFPKENWLGNDTDSYGRVHGATREHPPVEVEVDFPVE